MEKICFSGGGMISKQNIRYWFFEIAEYGIKELNEMEPIKEDILEVSVQTLSKILFLKPS